MSIPVRLLARALPLWLLGCSPTTLGGPPPGGDAGGSSIRPDASLTPRPPPPPSGCEAGFGSLAGTVHFPNGTLPVAGALVYVTGPGAEPIRSGECGECVDRGGLLAVALTGPEGRFAFDTLPAGTWSLVVEKGWFSRRTEIVVGACTALTVPIERTRLPRNTSEGRLPRIAVVGGPFDRMHTVLSRLGLDGGSFTVIDPDGADGSGGRALFADAARLMSYDLVFVNCGAEIGDAFGGVSDPRVAANTRTFLESGGRLYVTDLAYDLLEQTLPSAVDFLASPETPASSAEHPDVAQAGYPMEALDARVVDDGLAAWLHAVGATSGDRMRVEGLLDGWAVVDAVDESRTHVWVRGDVSWYEAGDLTEEVNAGDQPLTITVDVGCGRALFTSYHTIGHGEGSGALTPQELALAYLVLEIGTCIEDPTLI